MKQLRTRFKQTAYFLGRRTSLWLATGIVAGGLAGFAELGMSLLIQSLLITLKIIGPEFAINESPLILSLSSPKLLLAGLLIVVLVKALCYFLANYSGAVSQELLNARLRCIAIYDLLNSKKFVAAADVNARVGDTFPKAALFIQNVADGVPSLIQALVIAVFMILTAWREALLSFLFISITGVIILVANRHVRRIAFRIPGEHRALVAGIERVARNWLLVRVMRTKERELSKLNQNIINYSSDFVRSRLIANFAQSLPIFFGGFMLILLVGLNLYILHTPGPVLLAFLYLLSRFTLQIAVASKSFGNGSSYFPHFKLAGQYFFSFSPEELKEALHPSAKIYANGRRQNQIKITKENRRPQIKRLAPPDIDIRNLYFRYSSNSPYILINENIYVPSGSHLGIVGMSGSGKSTLLSLVLGVLRPSSGSILIGGQTPEAYFNDPSVRVGYVGAEAFLIEGSIRENLHYGCREDYTDVECWEALSKAQLKDAIQEKDGQLDFVLKENGDGLSAGQKQRLCLARALLTQPQILILDEASANLDEKTESEIQRVLETLAGEVTTLIVSHRPGLLKSVHVRKTMNSILDQSSLSQVQNS